jgi:hypothetical protein
MSAVPITLPWAARTARPTPFDPPEVFGALRDERRKNDPIVFGRQRLPVAR